MIAMSHIWLTTEKIQCRYNPCSGEATTLIKEGDRTFFCCNWHRDQIVAKALLEKREIKFLPDCKVEISFVPEEKA